MTLAQAMLEYPAPDIDGARSLAEQEWRKMARSIYNHARARLGDPAFHGWDGDGFPVYFSQEPDMAAHLAERIVFADNVPQQMIQRIEAREIAMSAVIANARLPFPLTWVEWSEYGMGGIDDVSRMGALLDGRVLRHSPGGGIALMAFAQTGERGGNMVVAPVVGLVIPDLPLGLNNEELEAQIRVRWTISDHDEGITSAEIRKLCTDTLCRTLSALFVLTVPKLTTERIVRPDAKLNKARAKRGKLPLFEYRHITTKLGGVQQRSTRRGAHDIDTSAEAAGKRLHQVIGHFRTYREGRDEPKVSWVQPHWRGNADLGVLLHERSIIDGGKPNDGK